MPRSYSSRSRHAAAQRTRERIIAAARRILRSRRGLSELTIDAVAREARVARMTVYNTFRSKSRLLEAIFDDIARSGLPEILPSSGTAIEAIDSCLAAFAHFWESERLSIRRLRALAVLDRDIGAAIAERETRRWTITLQLAERLGEERGAPIPANRIDQFHIAASFECYDRLRIMGHAADDAAREIYEWCQRIFEIDRR